MKKSMKSPSIKKVVVKCASFWMDEFEIDSDIFDDIYAEAATRAIEKRCKIKAKLDVAVVIETWEKKDFKRPEKHYCYNTYRIFINAAEYIKAEILRENFLKMYGIDLQKESLKGDDTLDEQSDGTTDTGTDSGR